MLSPEKKRRMALTAALASAAVAAMVGLSFAAVPLYQAFCRVTGYGGATQIAAGGPSTILARRIEVRFDANVAQDMPIEFTPLQRAETLRIGETGLARFRVRNLSDAPVVGVAAFNVTPHKAGVYFNKLQCFCFEEHSFAPGETTELAVLYYVDPELASDPNTEELETVTLSYTYFRSADAAAAALAPAS